MKELTNNEFKDAPNIVKYIYVRRLLKQPVSASLFNEAVTEYPSYFPKEAEARRKWDTIPQKVHEAYWTEYWKSHNRICKKVPYLGMGILYYAEHPQAHMEYTKAMNVISSKLELLKKKLHKKYYEKYGIDYK